MFFALARAEPRPRSRHGPSRRVRLAWGSVCRPIGAPTSKPRNALGREGQTPRADRSRRPWRRGQWPWIARTHRGRVRGPDPGRRSPLAARAPLECRL